LVVIDRQFGRDGTVSAITINAGGISRRTRPAPRHHDNPIAAASAWMLCSPLEREKDGKTPRGRVRNERSRPLGTAKLNDIARRASSPAVLAHLP
jgi:hypothetical protein